MAPAARAATVLHAVLFAGLAAIGGAFILVMQLQGGPLVSGARGAAVLVWLLCEGAGSIGWVGYLIPAWWSPRCRPCWVWSPYWPTARVAWPGSEAPGPTGPGSAPPGTNRPMLPGPYKVARSQAWSRRPPTDLDALLRQIYSHRLGKILFVKAAGDGGYQEVISAMDRARAAGVQVIGLVPRP